MTIKKAHHIWAALALFAASSPSMAGQEDIVDTAVAAGSFKTLATALTEAGLVETLKGKGPFTVFAPTDEAFAKIPQKTLKSLLKPENRAQLTAILTYHVVPGRVQASQVVKIKNAKTVNGQQVDITTKGKKVMVDSANVVKTDIMCSNGIIHVIDSVIMPSTKNIVETAVQAGSFNTLAAALKAGGLVEALQGPGPFTVFAPTDAAFAKLPAGTLESLLKPENKDQLVSILKYHVVPGRIFAADALKAGKAETLQKSKVWIRISDGKPKVNEANISALDIDATNGVIHVIDSVLLPGKKSARADSPRQVIELAISKGAPMFNHGRKESCAAIYEVATESLLSMDNTMLTSKDRRRLRRALNEARHSHDADRQSWTLRHALDATYASLGQREMPMMMTEIAHTSGGSCR